MSSMPTPIESFLLVNDATLAGFSQDTSPHDLLILRASYGRLPQLRQRFYGDICHSEPSHTVQFAQQLRQGGLQCFSGYYR